MISLHSFFFLETGLSPCTALAVGMCYIDQDDLEFERIPLTSAF